MTTALVLGGASCVWADVEGALGMGEFHGVVACNDAGVYWPGRLDAWVSLHPEKFSLWAARRESAGYPPHQVMVGQTEAARGARSTPAGVVFTQYRFPGQNKSGSSGLFALKVAIVDLAFDKAVLCGVPLDAEGAHFFDDKDWTACRHYRAAWTEALPQIKDRARAMGGWTAELLGRPDPTWLAA